MQTVTRWIGGKPVESASGRHGAVCDPATGAQEKQVGFASVDGVDPAVATRSRLGRTGPTAASTSAFPATPEPFFRL
ncbi:hypothetical protein [Streptomyces sp. NPDC058249]|uniref:hypothetical protein n=1 Tax=Streptomyces sp. NPDC058249 TaxID=3346403 RepID=UPI0036EC131A